MYTIDWAVRKKFQIYNVNTEKLKSISPIKEVFDKFFGELLGKHSFYIEEGGADTFKLLALNHGHKVFTTPGKKVKDFRDKLGWDKADENDAKIISIFAKEQPQEFYGYQEDDILIMKICLLHHEYVKIMEDSTRKKNQLFALKNKMELLTSEKVVNKVLEKRKNTIKALEKEIYTIRVQLTKHVEKHPLWINYLKDVKGVGSVTAAGIIGSIRRFSRFSNKYSLRCFAGMITKKDNHSYNRYLKQALHNFTEGIIRKRTPFWRELYDKKKLYYREKYPDWRLAKVDAYAKKFVQTKFLLELWRMGRELELGDV